MAEVDSVVDATPMYQPCTTPSVNSGNTGEQATLDESRGPGENGPLPGRTPLSDPIAHNPKVAGSNPAPATKKDQLRGASWLTREGLLPSRCTTDLSRRGEVARGILPT